MNISDSAVARLKELKLEENNPNLKFRVFVQGGGCSGFQYGFTFDEEQNEDDFDFKFDDLTIVVDSMSMTYMQECEIRFDENEWGSSFVINNPQASTTCGCGSSFSV